MSFWHLLDIFQKSNFGPSTISIWHLFDIFRGVHSGPSQRGHSTDFWHFRVIRNWRLWDPIWQFSDMELDISQGPSQICILISFWHFQGILGIALLHWGRPVTDLCRSISSSDNFETRTWRADMQATCWAPVSSWSCCASAFSHTANMHFALHPETPEKLGYYRK